MMLHNRSHVTYSAGLCTTYIINKQTWLCRKIASFFIILRETRTPRVFHANMYLDVCLACAYFVWKICYNLPGIKHEYWFFWPQACWSGPRIYLNAWNMQWYCLQKIPGRFQGFNKDCSWKFKSLWFALNSDKTLPLLLWSSKKVKIKVFQG